MQNDFQTHIRTVLGLADRLAANNVFITPHEYFAPPGWRWTIQARIGEEALKFTWLSQGQTFTVEKWERNFSDPPGKWITDLETSLTSQTALEKLELLLNDSFPPAGKF